jgi:hypothetical protein
MKTRVGKIARLPANIREEINQRLSQGALAKDLIAWLNERFHKLGKTRPFVGSVSNDS